MLGRSTNSRNFFRKMAVNGVSSAKAAIQNDCLMRLYDADTELKSISSELDSFDGKKDPVRCNLLVNQLRTAQDKVISLLFQLMDDCNCERASRDYRMKFPDEILLSEGSESLNGQIWFGAECLSAGSNILNHTKESITLRPMAKNLTMHLDLLRNELRDLVLGGGGAARIGHALIKKMVAFDRIFASFEYEYVRTMLPIRTVAEIEKLQEVAVLFSETLIDCVSRSLIKQEDIDEFEPIVMIAIPRLAIVRGLLYKNDNAIYTRHKSHMCGLFQPFHGALHSIRKLLRSLTPQELFSLEKMLANDPSAIERHSFITKPVEQKEPIKSSSETKQLDSNKTYNLEEYYDESAAGTSNGTSNALVNGLQYPVGKKRDSQDSSISGCFVENSPEQSNRNASPEASTSPVKSHVSPPAGSSPSTSSSASTSLECDGCARPTVQSGVNVDATKHQCDNNCCLTTESESQLEKMMAELHPTSQDHPTTSGQVSSNEVVITESSINNTVAGKPETFSEPTADSVADADLDLEEIILVQRLLHRLFVSIAGVADQLQSNFASDLRFILKHIFNTEEDEEKDDEDRDSNDELSDNSIEQGIEAQEVVNLIDLESGYSPGDTCGYDDDAHYAAVAESQSTAAPYGNYYVTSHGNVHPNGARRSSGSAPYGSVASNSHNTLAQNSRAIPDQDASEDILADLMRAARQPEVMYDSRISPNYSSYIEENRQRQQIMQQQIQSLARSAIGSRHERSSRSHRHSSSHMGESGSSHHGSGERRSRLNIASDGSSRARRPRGPPVWVPDQLVVACSCCNASFSFFRRRHHCRACGQIFCAECSKFTKNLNCWGYNSPVRVCEACSKKP